MDPIKQFYDDPSITPEKKKMLSDAISKGMARTEAESYISKTFYGGSSVSTPQPPKDEGTLSKGYNALVDTGKGINNFMGGVAGEIPKVAGETAGFLAGASKYNPLGFVEDAIKAPFSDKTYGELRDDRAKGAEKMASWLKGTGQKGKDLVQDNIPIDKNSIATKAGQLVTDIGASIAMPGGVATKGGNMLVRGGKLALDGGIQGAKFDIASQGEVTPESVGIGALGNTVLGSIGSAYKLRGKAYEGIANHLQGVDQITKNALQRTNLDDIKGIIEAGKRASTDDTEIGVMGHVGNKFQDVLDNLVSKQKTEYQPLVDSLSKIPNTYKSDAINGALTDLQDVYTGVKSSQSKAIQGEIDSLINKSQNEGLTLRKINRVKQLHTEANSLFNAKGMAKGTFNAQDAQNLRKELKGFIEDKATEAGFGGVKKLNQRYGEIQDLIDNITTAFGDEGQRGASLMKQVLSPVGDTKVKPLLKKIYDEVGIDLISQARIAKEVGQYFQDPRVESLLELIKGGKAGLIEKGINTVASLLTPDKLKSMQKISKETMGDFMKKGSKGTKSTMGDFIKKGAKATIVPSTVATMQE